MTWQFIRKLISSAKWKAEIRFHPFKLVPCTKMTLDINTIREQFCMTYARIKSLLDSVLHFWPQLRNVYPEQSLKYPDGDGVMRIYRSRFKSIEGVFQLQSLHHAKISEQPLQKILLWWRTSSIALWKDNWSCGLFSTSLICCSEVTKTKYASRAGIANGAGFDCHYSVLAWIATPWGNPYSPAYSLSR